MSVFVCLRYLLNFNFVCVIVCVYIHTYAIDKATELTEMGKGKHHIGDFLPPEEMEKFVETVVAVKEDRDPGGTTHANPCFMHLDGKK